MMGIGVRQANISTLRQLRASGTVIVLNGVGDQEDAKHLQNVLVVAKTELRNSLTTSVTLFYAYRCLLLTVLLPPAPTR
jgi:hypothetical protein